jgi:pyruvate/2-oxoacid:ferredoxin oxidoreductase alpha subunit
LENYILGLGGRDVNPEEFLEIFENMSSPKKETKKNEKNYIVIGVRA